MKDKKIFILYFHIDPITKEVFYVGQTKNLSRTYAPHPRHKSWHERVKENGFKVVIEKTELTKEEADFWETHYIDLYGRLHLNTGSLVNIHTGGGGTNGLENSEETKRKKSLSHIGKKYSPESIERGAKARRGIKKNLTPEQRKILSDRAKKYNTGRVLSASGREKVRQSKIGKPRPQSVIDAIIKAQSKPILLIKDCAIMELPSVTHGAIMVRASRKEVCRALKTQTEYRGFMFYYL